MDSSLIEERDNDSFVQLHAAHPSISSQHSSKLTPPQFTLSDGKSIGMQILPAARVRKEVKKAFILFALDQLLCTITVTLMPLSAYQFL